MTDWPWITVGWLLALAGAVMFVWAIWWDRSRGRRRCPRCWYNMGGVSGLECPECGRVASSERRLRRTRRRWFVAAAGVVIGVVGVRVPHVPHEGVLAFAPVSVVNFALRPFAARARAVYASAAKPGATYPAGLGGRWQRLLASWEAGNIMLRPGADEPGSGAEGDALVALRVLRSAGPEARIAAAGLRRMSLETPRCAAADRFAFLSLLVDLKGRWAARDVELALLDPDPVLRRFSVSLTYARITARPEIVRTLMGLFDHPDVDVREEAIFMLLQMAPEAAVAVPTLRELKGADTAPRSGLRRRSPTKSSAARPPRTTPTCRSWTTCGGNSTGRRRRSGSSPRRPSGGSGRGRTRSSGSSAGSRIRIRIRTCGPRPRRL